MFDVVLGVLCEFVKLHTNLIYLIFVFYHYRALSIPKRSIEKVGLWMAKTFHACMGLLVTLAILKYSINLRRRKVNINS